MFFIAKQNASASKVTVLAYVPEEWKGCEAEVDGQAIPAEPVTKNGEKLVRFEVDGKVFSGRNTYQLKQQNIIVAEKGKAADFRKINRY